MSTILTEAVSESSHLQDRLDYRRLSQFLLEHTLPDQRDSFVQAQEPQLIQREETIGGQDAGVVKSILCKLI